MSPEGPSHFAAARACFLPLSAGKAPPHVKQEARRAALRLLQGTAIPLVNRALAQADLSVASAQRKRSSGGTASLGEASRRAHTQLPTGPAA